MSLLLEEKHSPRICLIVDVGRDVVMIKTWNLASTSLFNCKLHVNVLSVQEYGHCKLCYLDDNQLHLFDMSWGWVVSRLKSNSKNKFFRQLTSHSKDIFFISNKMQFIILFITPLSMIKRLAVKGRGKKWWEDKPSLHILFVTLSLCMNMCTIHR